MRYEFTTDEGRARRRRISPHGAQGVYVADPGDPDAFQRMFELCDKDARTLAEMLDIMG
jgi:hypothetical protein